MADASAAGSKLPSLNSIFHWAMMGSMIFAAAASGGGVLTMVGNFFGHIGSGLLQAPDALSNIFTAVTTMDLASPASAIVEGGHHAADAATSVFNSASALPVVPSPDASAAASAAAALGVAPEQYMPGGHGGH